MSSLLDTNEGGYLRQLHTSEDDDSHRPWQGVINMMFWAGAIILANILCFLGQLVCGRGGGNEVPLGIACAVVGVCLLAVLVWLGITQVH